MKEMSMIVMVTSSALFTLKREEEIFHDLGLTAYQQHQLRKEECPLSAGPALAFVKALQNIEEVEIVLVSRNDTESGRRILNSLHHHGLYIEKTLFLDGDDPVAVALSLAKLTEDALFLTGNREDARRAMDQNLPACHISGKTCNHEAKQKLRLAFDYDGVLADDAAERLFQEQGLETFQEAEQNQVAIPHLPGPLFGLLQLLSKLQSKAPESISLAITTARGSLAAPRVISTLRSWDIRVDKSFFLGGLPKSTILSVYRPHLFFDDQQRHVRDAGTICPVAHVPYGVHNNNPQQLGTGSGSHLSLHQGQRAA